MAEIDEDRCPLCQKDNICGAKASSPCWCISQKVPPALIEQVPIAMKNKACICQACIKKHAEQASSANFYEVGNNQS